MTHRVYLHVGAPKSGTTFLQSVMEDNRAALAQAGVLVAGDRHVERVHAGLAVREDPRLGQLPPEAAGAWARLVEEMLAWHGDAAILSYELLAGASADQAAKAVAELGDVEVHVVISARDLGRAVSSAWQERLKFALTTPLEEWSPRPESDGPRAEWGWRTMDPAGVAARWGSALPPQRVHIVTVPRDQGPDELWRRFARACGIDQVPVNVGATRTNESLGVTAAEVLRRVNARLPPELDSNREQALWTRDVLAHQVLAPLDAEPIGITDAQFAEAEQRAGEAITAIEAAGYDVVGSLEDLRATRRGDRTPGQTDAAELLQVALDAVVRLLLMVRAGAQDEGGKRPEPSPVERSGGPRGLARRLVRTAALGRVEIQLAEAQARIERMESDLRASRQLQLRVAELSDLVAELLLPAHLRDSAAMAEAVRRYRRESL